MSRKLLSAIFIVTAVVLTGCSSAQPNNQSNVGTPAQSQQSNDNTLAEDNSYTESDNTTNKKDNPYNVIENTYKTANITIKYPQISNLGDDDKQTKINNFIKESVIDGYNLTETIKTGIITGYEEPIENLTLDVSYTIELQDSNILSIKYLGEGYIKGGIHPDNELFTANIDLINVKSLGLPDIVKVDQNLVNAFRKGTYIPWYKTTDTKQPDINTLLGSYNDRDLQTAFEQSDKPNGLQNPSDTHCYLNKDGIIIGIGVSHAAGDHAEIKINYNSIKNNIKSDNESLNNFFSSL